MKILHVCLACFYIDNYSYQENELPKYHKMAGHEVEIVASLVTFDKNGSITLYEKGGSYTNEHGIPVTRLEYAKGPLASRLRVYKGFRDYLFKSRPEIVFVHGCQFWDARIVAEYAKNDKNVRVFVDNHSDFSNSATNWLSKNVLHKLVWRACAKKIEPYTRKFYGVLPARVDFLRDVYGIDPKKVELLVMGANDELVAEAKADSLRGSIREQYGIKRDDFLIMTGGKIDLAKTQTLLLMKAVGQMYEDRFRLIVFGSVVEELKEELSSLVDGKKVQYIGWIQAKDAYRYMAAADLMVFPGRHSVLWEQAAGLGIPMLIKHWEGTTHLDLGGNCEFLYEDSVDEIKAKIRLISSKDRYEPMRRAAEDKGMKTFSYREIARRSIIDE
ncbi:MAG TPA: glycosyltransferase family 4 protein [Bacillota bacterium]|nr:glycosyltransferase family 4 protein [Bacillota bacterium]